MKVLKGLILSFLGLLLSLCLTVFGLAFLVNSTVLNPGFIRTEITELDISALAREFVKRGPGEAPGDGISSQALTAAVTKTVTQLEPLLKERVTAATDSVYEYLLGRRPDPDLATTLRGTILKTDFFTAIIGKLDLSEIIKGMLRDQLGFVPPEFQGYVESSLDGIVTGIIPAVRQQIDAAADPVLDYLVGNSDGFSVTVDAEQVKTSLRNTVHDAVFASLPPELAFIPVAQREAYFDQLFEPVAASIPPAFKIDQSVLPPDFRDTITSGLSQAEDGLTRARQYVAYFQLGYSLLIGLTLLLVAGIVLVHREVKGSARNLGIIFASYGAVEYAGVIVGRYYAARELPPLLVQLPSSLQAWMIRLTDRLISPLGMFSLAVLSAGVILLVISFVYPGWKLRRSKPDTPDTVPDVPDTADVTNVPDVSE